MTPVLVVAPHPLLEVFGFTAETAAPLGELAASDGAARIAAALDPAHASGLPPVDDATRAAVRDLLRHGGFKPTGRSKPSSEYLVAAAAAGRLGSINLAVDACNAASLHGGLPISVVDLDRARAPLAVGLAAAGARYVFNPSGQEIDIAGLICLHDADGPCANPVKDAQRTKTDATTRRTLTLVWGTRSLPGHAAAVSTFCRRLWGHSPDCKLSDLQVNAR